MALDFFNAIILSQCRQRKQFCKERLTENAESVVHGHHNHVAVGGQDAGVKHISGALHVGPSVDEQHHRLLPAVTNICRNKGGEEAEHREKIKSIKCIYASHIHFDRALCSIAMCRANRGVHRWMKAALFPAATCRLVRMSLR